MTFSFLFKSLSMVFQLLTVKISVSVLLFATAIWAQCTHSNVRLVSELIARNVARK